MTFEENEGKIIRRESFYNAILDSTGELFSHSRNMRVAIQKGAFLGKADLLRKHFFKGNVKYFICIICPDHALEFSIIL